MTKTISTNSRNKSSWQNPIIIIGAGRSGTNILRDVICSIDGLETWPCDEINYIWRHGNVTEPSDEFSEEHATDHVKKYIRKAFRKFSLESNAIRVVEKTCANSLRIPFINEIFPGAKYIHIIRDGRDVVNSARKRWTADLELDYILEKAKYIPVTDIPYYGFKYLGNRLHKVFSSDDQLATWGPRFRGIDKVAKEYSLEETCAFQWKRCVEKALDDFSSIDDGKVLSLRYENFVSNTPAEVERLLSFIDVDEQKINIDELSSMVHSDSEGKWKRQLSEKQISKVADIIEPTLQQLNYK